MKRRWYLLAALTTFIGALIIKAPVASLYGWVSARQAPAAAFTLYGLQGSIAEGRVAGIYSNGRPALSDLRWSLQAWRLLLGQAAFRISSDSDQATLAGSVAILPTGGTNLSDLNGRTSIKTLLAAIGQPYLPVDGRAVLNITTAKFRSHQLRAAEGHVQLQGLAWTLAASPVLLGDFDADTTSDDDNVRLKISSTSASPLEASGEANLKPDQSYDFHLQLRPRPDASPLVRNLVSSMGPPDSQGWSHLRQQGRLQ